MGKNKIQLPKWMRNAHFYTIVGTAVMVVIGQAFPMTKYAYVLGEGKDAKHIDFYSNAVQLYAFIGFLVAVIIPALTQIPLVRGVMEKFGLIAPKPPKEQK